MNHLASLSRAKPHAPIIQHVNRARLARLFLFLAVVLVATTALGQVATFPPAGKSLGSATAPEPGKWIVFATGFTPIQPTVLEGGKAIWWVGDAGEYAVIYFPPGDAQPVVSKVTLGGAAPVPPPGPTPAPLSAIAEAAKAAALSAPAAQREAVAASFDTVASQIAAGTLKDAEAIIAATRDANQKAVGDLKDAWLPFFEAIRKVLNDEASAGRLATPEAHQAAWEQIAIGVRAAK